MSPLLNLRKNSKFYVTYILESTELIHPRFFLCDILSFHNFQLYPNHTKVLSTQTISVTVQSSVNPEKRYLVAALSITLMSLFCFKLDLRSGYHQIRMALERYQQDCFQNPPGALWICSYTFWTYQRSLSISSIHPPHSRKFILVFFDDILIYRPNWESHLKHVNSGLEILQQNSLLIKKSKCSFGTSVEKG